MRVMHVWCYLGNPNLFRMNTGSQVASAFIVPIAPSSIFAEDSGIEPDVLVWKTSMYAAAVATRESKNE